jgi:anaerobic glycerol-3-phosphate dehydrogenase
MSGLGRYEVVVVGGGIAGTAAAWAATKANARVLLVQDRAGGTALYSGAADLAPWRGAGERSTLVPVSDELRAFFADLGQIRLGDFRIATRQGVVRSAAGADRALLDLAPLAGLRVAVADVERDDWDAPLLAWAFSDSDWALRTRTVFEPVRVDGLRTGPERRIAPYDFAQLHDEPARLAALASEIAEACVEFDACVVGPWLGVEPDTAERFQTLVPVPVGECTSPLAGAAGARLERACAALLARTGVESRRGRVRSVTPRAGRWAVELEPAASGERAAVVEGDAVVLAVGGVGAGGIRFEWAPAQGRQGFSLSLQAPVSLSLDGEELSAFGSLYGPSLERSGLELLERVGLSVDASGRALCRGAVQEGLFAAGDVASGVPRTLLGAAESGVRAGALAGPGEPEE